MIQISGTQILADSQDEASSVKKFQAEWFTLGELTTVISYLLFGNLIDNSFDHKYLVTACSLALGVAYLI